MKIKLLLIFFLGIFVSSYSQEKVDASAIYFENGMAINKKDNQVFTGIVQQKKKTVTQNLKKFMKPEN